MFLLSGPQREGAKQGEREAGWAQRRKGRSLFILLWVLLREIMRAEHLEPSRPGPFYLCCFD